MIRAAVAEDVPAIVALGRAMASESPRWAAMPYEPDKVAQVVGDLIESEHGLVFVDAEPDWSLGALVAVLHAHFFTTVSYAAILALYVPPDFRGRGTERALLAACEGEARKRGASELLLGVHTGSNHERTARLFRRLGYSDCGIDLRKPL